MQDLQQNVSDEGEELQRGAGAKEPADGNLMRMNSHLQQADNTIKVPSASSLHCCSDLLSIVPSEPALCHLPLFSLCALPVCSTCESPCFASAWAPCFSPTCQQHCLVKPAYVLGWHLQSGGCDSKLPPNHPVCEFKSPGSGCCLDTPVCIAGPGKHRGGTGHQCEGGQG